MLNVKSIEKESVSRHSDQIELSILFCLRKIIGFDDQHFQIYQQFVITNQLEDEYLEIWK